jgi:prolipoprotein diacylglyceryltransferase
LSEAHKYQLLNNETNILTVLPVHPTEIYELLAAGIGLFLASFLIRKKAPDGIAFLSFGIWFMAFRWFDYYLMVLPRTFQASPYFYPILYGFLIILCGVFVGQKLYSRTLSSPS